MASQIINIGTSPNKGDGEPLRTAFDKINDNFLELYSKTMGTVEVGDIKGSVFGDDSTLLVDGVNSRIPSSVLHGALPAIDGSALTGITATTLGGQNASYYLDYNNFTNTPTLITNNNQLTNGAGYITASSSDTLTNKSGNISMFTNDSNYLTSVPAQTFASLTDTPANFTGHGGKFVKVNVGENALEFVTSGSSQNAFSTIAVAGQSNVEADSVGDTLTLVAGTNVTITTVAGTDSVTINSTASGLTNLVDDTTPELGGNLSLNSNNVTGTGTINITGSLTATSGTLGSIQLIDNNIKSTDSTQLSIQTPTSFTNSGAPGVTIDGNINLKPLVLSQVRQLISME